MSHCVGSEGSNAFTISSSSLCPILEKSDVNSQPCPSTMPACLPIIMHPGHHAGAQLTFSIFLSSESPAEETILAIVKIGLLMSSERIEVILHRHAQSPVSQVILASIRFTFRTMPSPAENVSGLKAAPMATPALLDLPFLLVGVF